MKKLDTELDAQGLGKLLIYQTEKGDTKIDVYCEDNTVWMNQKSMAKLYQVTIKTINEHINNVIVDRELTERATIRNFRIVQTEGKRQVERLVKYYNLQMILAVGYRVRSHVGVHFRNWASKVLTEYLQKGFALNDDRLKNPKEFGADYFDELLERIRDIRASEKRFYQKVKNLFTLSVDYDKDSDAARKFFATVQNKIEFAATGFTAPELIMNRADATQNNMGLTAFKGVKVRRGDVTVAKNYLTQPEIMKLNKIVNMYLDYAEGMAEKHQLMYMQDWGKRLDKFLEFNEEQVLQGLGKVKRNAAESWALSEYEQYDKNRRQMEAAVDELAVDVKKIRK